MQRLVGDLAEHESHKKINIDAFFSVFNEYRRGTLRVGEFQGFFELDAKQVHEMEEAISLMHEAPNKAEFCAVFKDLVRMGIINFHPRYRDMLFILDRLEDELLE